MSTLPCRTFAPRCSTYSTAYLACFAAIGERLTAIPPPANATPRDFFFLALRPDVARPHLPSLILPLSLSPSS